MASSAAFELVLELKNEVSRGLKDVKDDVGGLDNALDGANDAQGGFFGGMGGGIAKLGLMATGIGAVASVGGELVGFLKDATTAAAEEQVGIDRLNQTLANSIPGWDGNTDAIEQYISKQEQMAFADDELRDSLNFLVMQTGSLTEAQELQAAAMDLARAKGMDLQQATKLVGKVDADNIGILARHGIIVDENATKEEALAAIRAASAGQAETYANSMQGSMDRVGMAFDNAKETIGGAIMQGITPLLQGLATFISGPEFQGFIAGAADFIGKAFQTIGSVVGTVWGFIEGTILPIAQAVFDQLSKWWTEIEPGVTDAWNAISSAIGEAWAFIEPLLKTGLEFLQRLWNEVWPGIQSTFEGVWGAIQGILQIGWSVISGIWNTVTSILKGDWEGAWNAIKGMFEGVWNGIKDTIDSVWQIIKGLWDTGTAYIRTVWETAWQGIQDFFTGVWTFITQDLPKKLGEIWNGITTWVSDSASKLGTEIMAFVTNFWNWITTTVTELPGRIAEIWNSITGWINDRAADMGMEIIKFTQKFWNWITETVSGLPGKLGEIWTKITTWISDTANDIWTKVQEIGTQIVEGIKAGISGAWEAFTDWIGDMFQGAVDGVKEFLGISSPSRLMAEQIGVPMVQGIQMGFEGEMPAFNQATLSKIAEWIGSIKVASQSSETNEAGSTVVGGIREGFEEAWGAFHASAMAMMEATWGEAAARAAQIAQMMANAQATGSASAGGGVQNPIFNPPWYGGGSPQGGNTGGVQVLDRGGIVMGPRLAALAMDGRPEAVIPLDRLDRMGGGGRGVTINVTVAAPLLATSEQQAARHIARILYDELQGRV